MLMLISGVWAHMRKDTSPGDIIPTFDLQLEFPIKTGIFTLFLVTTTFKHQ